MINGAIFLDHGKDKMIAKSPKYILILFHGKMNLLFFIKLLFKILLILKTKSFKLAQTNIL
jgi:hypothetical protein